jgi:YHS domain-containing protein
MITKNGIYLDINDSIYHEDYKGNRYYFSSLQYKNKFKKMIREYIRTEEAKLQLKYKMSLSILDSEKLELFLALSFYNAIEKRGHKVVNLITNENIFK